MTHQIVGVGLAAVAVAALDVQGSSAAAVVGASWLGAMLPDADLAGARVYRRTLIERRVTLIRPLGALVRLPLRVLALLPHRGITHSALGCALATVGAGALASLVEPGLSPAAAAGMAIGYGAHVAADACTPSGVAAWAPFSRRRAWLIPAPARIRTGSAREYLIATLATIVLVFTTVQFLG